MTPITFSLVDTGNEQFVTVFAPGRDPLPANSSHPNFQKIVAACAASVAGEYVDPNEVADLFDIGATIERKFERLSERVTVENGEVCLDGDPVQDGLTKQILRFMDEGEDFDPLVNFMEKIQSNPNDHSRAQAWDWLNNHDFTITEEGDVIGYKGVNKTPDGSLVSGWTGKAMVDGEWHEGHIPNEVGVVVEMPRSEVAHDPAAACSRGLHMGTFGYAKSYARGAMLKVVVNPRDIVSVPTDAHGEKIRVCRYRVVEVIDAPETTALWRCTPAAPDPDGDYEDDLYFEDPDDF